ncbi:hypothetical protein RHSIM_Rhsim02G0170700 [Rhododendron simsii]|uniref:Uncharacterized protein n=1 Tax=Rhododendron simsii TaxID=118357 RepID=A0A834HM41_RHOSS|nr:hypothetical protein RHSIM_Rhsim02G0170700 [Rhododendron simsii]
MSGLIYPGGSEFPRVPIPGNILYDPKACVNSLNAFSMPVFDNLSALTTDHLCRNLHVGMGRSIAETVTLTNRLSSREKLVYSTTDSAKAERLRRENVEKDHAKCADVLKLATEEATRAVKEAQASRSTTK